MQKYFISENELENKMILGEDAFHIKTVMRGRVGDFLLVSSGQDTFKAKITEILDRKINFEITEKVIGNHELPVFVSVIQGYPKGDKLEDIIKHGTELGAGEFVPVLMKRSLFKLDLKKKEAKLLRFNKIAKEAAEQSYRDIVPKVLEIQELKNIDYAGFDVKLVCYEESAKNGELTEFKKAIRGLKPNMRVAVAVGPEGGIDDKEIEFFKSQGFIPVSLGSRILRTETVVFYCLSAIGYEMELK